MRKVVKLETVLSCMVKYLHKHKFNLFIGRFYSLHTKIYVYVILVLLLFISVLFVVRDGMKRREMLATQEATKKTALQIVENCKNTLKWSDCYGYALAKVNTTKSIDFPLAVLRVIQQHDFKTTQCHVIAHRIAASEVAKYPSKWLDIIRYAGQNYCNYGFIHGVIEARSRYDYAFVLNASSIENICKNIEKNITVLGGDQTCAHIMGHVLLAEENADLPVALKTCSTIPENMQYMCYSGVFMENFTRDNIVAHEVGEYIAWNEETIKAQENLCKQYNGIMAQGCWLEMSHLYNELYEKDPEKVHEACSKASTKIFKDECYMHAVATLVEKKNATDTYLLSLCQPFKNRLRDFKQCMGIAVKSLVNTSALLTPQAIKYCKIIPQEFTKDCFITIGFLLKSIMSSKERVELCQEAPLSYQRICLGS